MIKNCKLVICQSKIIVMVSVSILKKRPSVRFLLYYFNLLLKKNSSLKFGKNVRNVRKNQGWHFILFRKTKKTYVNPLEKLLLEALTCFNSCT